eukprot:2037838-Rhodomonas_salina.1
MQLWLRSSVATRGHVHKAAINIHNPNACVSGPEIHPRARCLSKPPVQKEKKKRKRQDAAVIGYGPAHSTQQHARK